ncbi:MAG TPA: CpaF family protein [Kouleothrix sp.]|jgi:pilus assembly protein CpaF|nr:CpaF family protein [Kouleothrix sp.]
MNRIRFTRPAASPNETKPVVADAPVMVEPKPAPAEPPVPSGGISREDRELIEQVQSRLLSESNAVNNGRDPEYLNRRIATLVNEQLEMSGRVVSERERMRLARLSQAEMLGFGPLEPLLSDESITEIMVNGPDQIWIEREGRLVETNARFADENHVRRIIDRIISPLGRRCDETMPMVDARLPDGSRVNAIIPPLCLNGPSLTIRKFFKHPLSGADLVRRGSATPELIEFLRACVLGRLNVIVSGGTGTGKTTLLNVLSSFIPEDERIITIENAAELQLQQRHVITLESRPANIEGRNEIGIRELVVNALRMRPDRIVVGECRAGESLDMLQAMNTGHDGSMTTLHANSPRDALHRMETMVMMAGMDLPIRAIREQISSAINIIVQLERMQDGSRRITHVSELTGLGSEAITMSDLFVFQRQGIHEGRIVGRMVPTGIRPRFMERLQQLNITLPPQVFGVAPMGRG